MGFVVYPDKCNGHPDKPHSETKSKHPNFSKLNAASTAALFDFAIELSYGDPGETKRLRIEISPNTNRNHALPIGNRQVQNHPVQQKKKKLLFRVDFRELAIGKLPQKRDLWPNQPVAKGELLLYERNFCLLPTCAIKAFLTAPTR